MKNDTSPLPSPLLGSRLLIVEDNMDVRGLLCAILEDTPHHIEVAADGQEALEKWKKSFSNQPYDLMTIDLNMPRMDGKTLIHEIRKIDNEIAMIVFTGYGELPDALTLLQNYQIFDFLHKPLKHPSQLLFSVANALEKRRLSLELKEENAHLKQYVEERTADLQIPQLPAESTQKSKMNFLTNMHHEIHTPLNAIIGFSKLITRQAPTLNLPQETQRYLENITTEGKRLNELLDNMLTLSKLETGTLTVQYEDLNLKQLIEGIFHMSKSKAADKQLDFTYHWDPLLPEKISCDRTFLNKLLMNLVDNAIKFTNPGKMISLEAWKQKDQLLLRVIDEGIGIPQDKLDVIFQNFERIDKSNSCSGTGIGLSVSQKIGVLLGGNLKVESHLGEGSMFSFSLPLKSLVSQQSPEQSAPHHKNFAKDNIIVLVEDNKVNQMLVKALFKELGLTIQIAENGKIGVEMIQTLCEEKRVPDLVLMDLNMPEMDGLTAIKILQQQKKLKDMPIVILSADKQHEKEDLAKEAGASDYLAKPLDFNKFFPLLVQYLRSEHEDTASSTTVPSPSGKHNINADDAKKTTNLEQILYSENQNILSYLQQSRIFDELPQEIIQKLIPLSKIQDFSAGEVILEQGTTNDQIYILLRGIVGVYVDSNKILQLRRVGDIFGEMSIINEQPCSSSILAENHVRLLSLKSQFIGRYSEMTSEKLQNLLYRLFAKILSDKLALTTNKAKQYESAHQQLLKEIDSHRQLANKFKESEEQYRAFYHKTPAMLHSIDKQGKLLSVSQYWLEKMGYQLQEVIGTNISAYLTEESQVIAKEDTIPRLIQEGNVKEVAYQFVKKNGEIIDIELSAIAKYNSDGEFESSWSTLYDVTDRKKTEHDLILAKEEAVRATRAKSYFLATMSHEIRTPMNGVLGTTQLLSKTQLNADQQKYVHALLTSGQQLLCTINDILDYSKLEANKLTLIEEPFNPSVCVKEVIEMMKSHAKEKKVRLYSVVDSGVSRLVLGDPIRLKQILNNLVNNAIKFTKKGEISLTVNMVLKDSPYVNLLFKVRDTGIGIPPDQIQSLFEEFSQIDSSLIRQTGGTGLGLPICQKLLRLMDSELLVESQEGVGSEFYFTLPFFQTPEVNVVTDISDTSSHALKTIEQTSKNEILLAEDNQINQMVAKDMLQTLGYSVDTVSNGQEALTQLKKKNYGLILMDIHMPVMDGITATKHIIQNYPEENRPVIIALTADALPEEKKRYLQEGVDHYLSKPLDLNALKALLQNYSVSNGMIKKDLTMKHSLIDSSTLNKLDPNLRNQLIEVFEEQSPALIEAIKQAAVEHDSYTIKEKAHSLKGSALAFGATNLIQICASLQKRGETNNLEGMESELIQLQKIYEQTLQTLQK